MVRLSIDFEFPSRDWWENGGQELWDAIAEGFDGSYVVVDADLAESWLAQARAIAGWNAGSEYSPHPVHLTPLEDDDADLL
ncbi:MAG TPA: hypothetical protein VIY27_06895 [Myxococcota bacterium]